MIGPKSLRGPCFLNAHVPRLKFLGLNHSFCEVPWLIMATALYLDIPYRHAKQNAANHWKGMHRSRYKRTLSSQLISGDMQQLNESPLQTKEADNDT